MEKLDIFDLDSIQEFIKNGKEKAKEMVSLYPYTNIGTFNENLIVEINVAGFAREEIEIELIGNKLIVEGKLTSGRAPLEYVQKELTVRDFKRVIVINDLYINGDIIATMSNGILTINIEPQETRTRIKIS
jgi:HSP20 family molecular chaperone IbpA